jgi:hypothetical protein
MAIAPLATWRSTFANLPLVTDTSWQANIANWVNDNISGANKLALNGMVGTGLTFTFNKASFQSGLASANNIAGFANALSTALTASLAVVAVGSSIANPPTPASTFSAVITTVVDPASITAANAKILELNSAQAVESAYDSDFPLRFREAILLLTVTTSGTNSVTPTPAALVDTSRAVI